MRYLLFLLLPGLSWAQDSTHVPAAVPVNYLQKSVWRVDFLGPGVIQESRLGRQTTVVTQARFVYGFNAQSNTYNNVTENNFAYSINPQLSLAVRQFYNLNRRLEQGRFIRYNSGNYVTAKVLYNFPPVLSHTSGGGLEIPDIGGTQVQVLWGFQRTYRRNFYLNLEVGLGHSWYDTVPVGVASYFTLGYTFPGRSQVKTPGR